MSKFSSNLSSRFCAIWKRWQREYLYVLRERHINKVKSSNNLIKQGDVVLVHDDVLPRLKWKLGLVTELYVGADGLVRSAEVKIGRTLPNRPVSKLYPLEVTAQDTEFTDGAVPLADSRPVRVAAKNAVNRIAN